MVTFAVLKNKKNGELYAHYNTHLGIDRAAMRKQLSVLRTMTDACEYPFVLTGDFNVDMDWLEYDTMREYWTDSRDVAPVTTDFRVIDYCIIKRFCQAQVHCWRDQTREYIKICLDEGSDH
ncbi:MAG: hypothetical protein IJD75_02675 [Clostridia bacterium]|nr:hypothetical protein [Clostridia bacterium]